MPTLPFVSATNGGTYDATKRTVTWNLGTVPVNATGTLSVKETIGSTVPKGTQLLNEADFTAPLTFATPAAMATFVT